MEGGLSRSMRLYILILSILTATATAHAQTGMSDGKQYIGITVCGTPAELVVLGLL